MKIFEKAIAKKTPTKKTKLSIKGSIKIKNKPMNKKSLKEALMSKC